MTTEGPDPRPAPPTAGATLSALEAVIVERKRRPPAGRSYVVSLLEGGVSKIGAKIVEEAAEVVQAADEPGADGRAHLVHEVADLIFHTLVMLGHKGVPLAEVESELARRFGVGGFEEKEARGRRPG